MKSFLRFFLISISLLLSSKYAQAVHISGAELVYKCVGNNRYVFTYNMFLDCADPQPLWPSYEFSIVSGCLDTLITTYMGSEIEVSQLCPAKLPMSKCKKGSNPYPGRTILAYISDTVTLPPNCTYSIRYGQFDRNNTTNAVATAGTSIFIEDIINTSVRSCNNSPTFNTPYPIPYVCVNQPVNYNFAVEEIDGDSLSYDLICGQSFYNVPINYLTDSGYTCTEPVHGIKIDNVTGQLSFTPTIQGNFIVVVEVSEFDRATKQLIGRVTRDIQFVVQACSNNVPTGGEITNLTGTADSIGPYSLSLCEGDSFRFNAIFNDLDATDSLSGYTNIARILPGAKITASGTNPLVATISWTAPVGSSLKNNSFFLSVKDNACPVPGIQSFGYRINVKRGCCTNAGPDVSICGTDSAHLSVIGGDTFKWTILSGDMTAVLSCSTCSNPAVKPLKTTTFVVTSNLSSCNTDTVIVYVTDSTVTVSAGADTSICKGSGANLNVTGGLGNATYSWQPTTGLSKPDIKNPVASPTVTTTYTVTVNNGGCAGISKDAVTVKVNNIPVVTAGKDTSICWGDTAGIVANSGLSFYSWSPGDSLSDSTIHNPKAFPAITTNYVVIGTDANGCKNKDTVVVNILPPPDSSFTATSTVCVGNNATIAYAGNAGNSAVYQWDFDGGTLVSGSGKNPQQVNWNAPGTKKITLIIKENNCSSKSSKDITVFPVPLAPVVTPASVVCKGFVAGDLIADSITEGTFNWYSDSLLQNLVNTGRTFSSMATSDTTFWVTETKGCTGPKTAVNVIFYDLPDVSFNPTPTSGDVPLTVLFTNTSSSDVTSFFWEMGDGVKENISNPSHTYNTDGTYIVTLRGKNANNCEDTAQATIIVHPFSSLIIPNVFTPNGDNANDVFKVQAFGIKEFNAVIYNRWGTKVYELKTVDDVWDGLNCEDGTYYYVITAIGYDEKSYNRTGYVLLISKK